MTNEDFTLYEMHLSGNCYKIRLAASLLGIKLKLVEHDVTKGETQTPEFLSNINSNGRVPVLKIGKDVLLPESSAACFYLASTASSPKTKLIPDDKLENARMLQWMFFEQYSHEPAIAVLRFWYKFVGEGNFTDYHKMLLPRKMEQGKKALDVMEEHLEGREWFVGDGVTLADVVLFAYTHCAHEGRIDLEEWPRVKQWVRRVEGIDGFISMDE